MNTMQTRARVNGRTGKRKAEQCSCELCEKATAQSFCLECKQCICTECKKIHSKMSTSKLHKVVDMNEKPNDIEIERMKSNYCSKHSGIEIVLYCCDCNELLCCSCHVIGHRTHKCISSAEVVKSKKDAIETCSKTIERCLKYTNQKSTGLKDEMKKYDKQVLEFENSVEKLFSDLTKLLAEQKANVRKQVRNIKDTQVQYNQFEFDQFQMHMHNLNDFLLDCKMVLEKGNDLEIINAVDRVHKRANSLIELQNKHNKEVRPEIKIMLGESHVRIIQNVEQALKKIDAKSYTYFSEVMLKFISKKRNTVVKVMHHKSRVWCLTVVDGQIFEILGDGLPQIYVFDALSFAVKPHIAIPDMRSPRDLAGCSQNKALYISDQGLNCIHRVSLKDNTLKRWGVREDYDLQGLSVTSQHNVLVTVWVCDKGGDSKIIEYTSEGELIREIVVGMSIVYAHQALESSDGNFIICHGLSITNRGLCIIDSMGRIIKTYCNQQGVFDAGEEQGEGAEQVQECGQLKFPFSITQDRGSGYIFVVDHHSDDVQMFTQNLCNLGPVKIYEPFYRPVRVFFDWFTDRLYVCQGGPENRVSVISPDSSWDEFKKRCNYIDLIELSPIV